MGIFISKKIAFVYVSISGKMYILSYTYTIQCNNAYIFGECIQLILNIYNWHSGGSKSVLVSFLRESAIKKEILEEACLTFSEFLFLLTSK